MPDIYLARFHYGTAELAKVGVKTETPKTYVLTGEREHIVDKLFSGLRTVRKNDSSLRSFDSELKALLYLRGASTAYVQQCQQKIAKAWSQVASLEQLIADSEQDK